MRLIFQNFSPDLLQSILCVSISSFPSCMQMASMPMYVHAYLYSIYCQSISIKSPEAYNVV